MEWFEMGIGYDITLWFNGFRDTVFGTLLLLFNFTGGEAFYILLFPLIYWCINKSLGKRLIVLSLLTIYVNSILKDLWMRPRPYNVSVPGKDQIINRLPALNSYGLPSGHTMGATAFWGYLSTRTKKTYIKISLYFVILFTGISRLVHGMHFIQDVVVGLIISIIILVLFFIFEPKISDTCNQRYTLLQRLFLVFFTSGGAIVLLLLFRITPLGDGLVVIGGFFGAMTGIVLEKEYIGFSVDGVLVQRIGRYLFGILLLLFTYIGLKYIFGLLEWDGDFFRFLRYVIVGFMATYPIPKIFVHAKLAEVV
ncbi:MAG: hypothetical protein B6229_06425 [Spirochaetaceae bacterium 4572_7]|nr:MAG: hypothetical protein B6229_06425 [Spirochaetaceae bacterium 4572_7]